MHHIVGYSGDKAARSPLMAPWSIYPFGPIDCAALICDMLVFDTTVSADALVEILDEPASHLRGAGAAGWSGAGGRCVCGGPFSGAGAACVPGWGLTVITRRGPGTAHGPPPGGFTYRCHTRSRLRRYVGLLNFAAYSPTGSAS